MAKPRGIETGSSFRFTSPVPLVEDAFFPTETERLAAGQVRHISRDYCQRDTATYYRILPIDQCLDALGEPATQAGTWGTLEEHWVEQGQGGGSGGTSAQRFGPLAVTELDEDGGFSFDLAGDATDVLELIVVEASGGVRELAAYAVSGTTVSVDASARLRAGDVLRGVASGGTPAGPPPASTPTVTVLTDVHFWDNVLSVARVGYSVRNPFAPVKFTLPNGQTSFEVQAVDTLPNYGSFPILHTLGVKVNGVRWPSLRTTNGTQYYTVNNLPPNAVIEIANGMVEKLPNANYTGVFLAAIRTAGAAPNFLLPAPPLHRMMLLLDSIGMGAYASDISALAYVNLLRDELEPLGWRFTCEGYSARRLKESYSDTADRQGFRDRIEPGFDGMASNAFYQQLSTNDKGIDNTPLPTFLAWAGDLFDDLHADLPDLRLMQQVPTLRTEAGASWIAEWQDGVASLGDDRSWLEIITLNIEAAQLFDGLHLTTMGNRIAANDIKTVLLYENS